MAALGTYDSNSNSTSSDLDSDGSADGSDQYRHDVALRSQTPLSRRPTPASGDTTLSAVSANALRSLRLDDPALLRGTRISKVLRHRARILADRPVEAAFYQESARVDHFDAFISHNWSTPRQDQFLALALHFNLVPAVATATTVSGVSCALTASGLLPCIEEMYDGEVHTQGFLAQVSGTTAFLVSIIWGHGLRSVTPLPEPVVFLDKYCVHQTDVALKRQGIMHLPAFLSYSWSMVVLFSDVYLRKLWTVYELATFLLLFPEGCLIVLPLRFPHVAIGLMLLICLSRLFFALFWLPLTQRWLTSHFPGYQTDEMRLNDVYVLGAIVMFPIMFVLTLVCRAWARAQADMYETVKSFSITDAACLSEEDRCLVERNVAFFSKHFGLVPPEASNPEALSKFDRLVHEQVPHLVKASMGSVGFPYRHAAMMFAVYIPYFFDSVAGAVVDGRHTVRACASSALWAVSLIFGVGPLCVALCFVLSEWLLLDMRGLRGCCKAILVVVIVCVAYAAGTLYFLNGVFDLSCDSWSALLVNSAFSCCLVYITNRVYNRSRRAPARRLSPAEPYASGNSISARAIGSRFATASGIASLAENEPVGHSNSSAIGYRDDNDDEHGVYI